MKIKLHVDLHIILYYYFHSCGKNYQNELLKQPNYDNIYIIIIACTFCKTILIRRYIHVVTAYNI